MNMLFIYGSMLLATVGINITADLYSTSVTLEDALMGGKYANITAYTETADPMVTSFLCRVFNIC